MTHTDRTLVLLDVDGVLVHPVGYKEAIRVTVNFFAAQMGQPPLGPDDDEIAVFEACGITNEWDSGAMCVSALLLAALDRRPDLRRETLDETLAAIGAAGMALTRPDFVGLVRELEPYLTDGQVPSLVHLSRLKAQIDAANLPLVTALLGDVYDLNTPTTGVFQASTLGARRFREAYCQPPPVERESLLAECDVPLLTGDSRDRLLRWTADADHGAAIFTARPSMPPSGKTHAPASGCAPEAELAVELVGLDGQVPLIAHGRIDWLAGRHGRVGADYIKPAPVQALAAIGAAASGAEIPALEAAAALAERDELTGPLAALADGSTHVMVFEDSITGVNAVRLAVEQLKRAGLAVTFEAVGVSPNADKQAALARVADRVVDDVNAGLALVPGWPL